MWIGGILGALSCGFITVTILITLSGRRGRDGLPPGPRAWPVLGHLHLFSHALPHRALAALSQQYGPILGLRLGQQRAIVVSTPECAREVLLTHDKLLADRPPFEFTSLLIFGSQTGVVFNRLGPLWRNSRKICTLRLFTAKRLHELQHVRQEELHTLLLSIHRQSCTGTRAVDLGKCMGQMSSRLATRLVLSEATVQLGDENLQAIMKEAEQAAIPTIADLQIPFLSVLDFFRRQRMCRIQARLNKMYADVVKERKKSTCLHDDLLQTLLSPEEGLSVDEIKGILHDMISAGIHTTALTIEWAMAELLRNPHCFHRLQREIHTQVGERKEVREEDLPSLPYLKCILKEVFRLHPIAPLLVPRISTKEFKLRGYTISAMTWVFVNVWAIGRDEQVWPNPHEFIPERFEGKDVDMKGQHFELLPFGSGRRGCLGMPLALLVIEATLANLVSCFDWKLPDGETHTSIDMDEKRGMAAGKAAPVLAIPKAIVSLPKLPNVMNNEHLTVH